MLLLAAGVLTACGGSNLTTPIPTVVDRPPPPVATSQGQVRAIPHAATALASVVEVTTPLTGRIADDPTFDPVTFMAQALSQCTGVAVTDTETLLLVAESDLSDEVVRCVSGFLVRVPVPSPTPPESPPPSAAIPTTTRTPPAEIVAEPAFSAVTVTARALARCTGISASDTAGLLQAAAADLTDELVQCVNKFLMEETGQ